MRIHRWRVAGLFTESVGGSPPSPTISGVSQQQRHATTGAWTLAAVLTPPSHTSNSDTFNFSVIAFRQSDDCNEQKGCRVSAVFMSRDNYRVTRHNEGDITRDTGPGGHCRHCCSTLALITQLQPDAASPAWNKWNIFSSFRISKLEPFPPPRPVSVSPGAGLMTSRRQCQCGAGVLQWYNRQNTGGS